jgi:hypothetical protein
MKPKVELLDWERILLDTSTILDYLKVGSSDIKVSERIEFTKKLIDFLVDSKTQNGTERKFLISAISLSEIKTLNKDADVYKEIIFALNASNVEIIPFDRRLALFINSNAGDLFYKKNLNFKITEAFHQVGDYSLIREWLIKDYLIAYSGLYSNCDVILTADERTFKPACNEIKCPCSVTLADNFNHSGKNVFYYQGS